MTRSSTDPAAPHGPRHAALGAALAAVLTRHPLRKVALAYSGGADSSLLLHLLAEHLAAHPGRACVALHIHHGLSSNADAWLGHCANRCASLGMAFDHARIALRVGPGDSVEAVARTERYAALAELCARHGATLLLTAHHAGDQAETLLFNLLRGSGVAGLAGMAAERPLRSRSDPDLLLARPLLDWTPDALRDHATRLGLGWIEDESNQELRYTRNAIRQRLLPVVRALAPTALTSIAQSATLAGEAQALLEEVGQADVAACRGASDALRLGPLRALSPPRRANALRTWLREQGLRAPSRATLAAMLDQIARRQPANGLRFAHDGRVLHAWRDVLSCTSPEEIVPEPVDFRWRGEAALDFPAWHGRLIFRSGAPDGIPARWLTGQPLQLRGRTGGERLQLALNRPSRSLKNLYQEHAVPAWLRPRLPLLYAGDQLLLAAGLGSDARVGALPGAPDAARIGLVWEAQD